MKEITYKRSDLNVTVTEVTLDELSERLDEIHNWDGRLAADVVYIEYADGSAYYYDGQSGEGDLRNDGIVCALIVDDVDVYVYGDYYVDADGEVKVFDARLSLEAFAEACADSQTELDIVLARIACDFDTFKHFEKDFVSECKRLAEDGTIGIERDAADYAIGGIISWAKERVEAGDTVSFRVFSFIGYGECCPDPDSELFVAECDTFAVARAIAEDEDIIDMARGRCKRARLSDSEYSSFSLGINEVEKDGFDSEVCVYEYTL